MYSENEQVFYYITMYNEDYAQPEMPAGEGVREGILRGLYRYKPAAKGNATAQLFGSGTILNEVLKAQEMLSTQYGVEADVWSVPSYIEVRRDALAVERWNRLHPAEKEKQPYLLSALADAKGPIIAASDYMKVMPDALAPWLGSRLVTLGTDGFGRSDNREHLRPPLRGGRRLHRRGDACRSWYARARSKQRSRKRRSPISASRPKASTPRRSRIAAQAGGAGAGQRPCCIPTLFCSLKEGTLGKPLISDAAMRGMHETMQRIRAAKRHATESQDLSKAERRSVPG